MYCSHFGLHRPPFNNTPDPSFYYSTPDHEEALATLEYATLNRKGFVLVTGEVGAGKTLIGRMFIRQIDRQASTAVITHTQLNARQLLAAICAEFELGVPADATNLQLADRLQEYLLEQFARDRFVVILLDEGQNLPDDSFEALRMLGNLEADDAKLLQVCILGQPELRNRFKQDNLRQLDQRLFRRFHLQALNQQQTVEYIQQRLSIAGCPRTDLFSPEALERVFAGSCGIPRVINRICDNALLTAYAQGHRIVDESVVMQVLEQEGMNESTRSSTTAHAASSILDSVEDAAYAEESGFVTAQPNDARTQARIEQIYGSSPELVETTLASAQQPSATAVSVADINTIPRRRHDDFGSPSPDNPIREAFGEIVRQWPEFRQSINSQRQELQGAINDVTLRCQQAQEQIETLAATAAPAAGLNELSKLHAAETQRVLDEITQSKRQIEQMVHQTDARLADTQAQFQSMRASALTKDALVKMEQQQKERIQDAVAQFQQYRDHIGTLVQHLRRQCDQIQQNVTGLSESCTRMRSEIVEETDTKLAELQKQYYAQLNEHFSETATTADLEQIRQIAAKAADLESLRQDMLTPADLEAVRNASAEAMGTVKTELETRLEETAQTLADRVQRATRGLSELREMQDQQQTALQRELQESLTATQVQLLDRIHNASQELTQLKSSAEHNHTELSQRIEQSEERQEGLLAQHKNVIDDLARRVVRCDGQIKTLNEDVSSRLANAISKLSALESEKATLTDIQTLRDEQQAAVADICTRLDAKATELADMKTSMNGLLVRASQAQAAGLQALSARLDDESRQVRQLRQRLIEAHAGLQERVTVLQQECATRTELEELRRDCDQQNTHISTEMETNRQAMQRLFDGLTGQFATAQQKLEALAQFTENDSQQLGALRQTHAEDIANVQKELEHQRELIQSRFEKAVEEWTTTQHALEALRGTAADAATVEHLRTAQEHQAQQIRQVVTEQQQQLEALTQSAEQRFESLVARLNALPADIATADDVRAVQKEHLSNKAVIEAAIHSVVEQCDRTALSLQGLENRAASQEQVEELRQTQTQSLQAISARLESTEHEHQRELQALNQRWAGLREELQGLAQTSTSVEKFEAAERQFSENLTTLKQRLDDMAQRRVKDTRVLIEVAQQLTERVKTLEDTPKPEPVKIELRPQAAEELAKLNTAAEQQAGELRNLLANAGAMGDQLRSVSTNIEQIMRDWLTNAEQVQQQTAQLRESAESSANILQALRKCNESIDAKLKSKRWQSSLAAGEHITTRLEQATSAARKAAEELHTALDNYDQGREAFDSIAQQRVEAHQIAKHLAHLVAEARKSEGQLHHMTNRVGSIATGIAQKTAGLAELLESAREFDEQQRPIRGEAKTVGRKAESVSTINWPKYRTHPAVRAS